MERYVPRKEPAPTKRTYSSIAQALADVQVELAKRKARKPGLPSKIPEGGEQTKISPQGPDFRTTTVTLTKLFGGSDVEFLDSLIQQLSMVGLHGMESDVSGTKFLMSVIRGVEPKDQTEAMLAAQMAAVHLATMSAARELAHAEYVPQQDSAARAFSKLARIFIDQVEALKRYRTGGQQKVTVEHVTVNQGGQAIVGNVKQTAAPVNAAERDPMPPPALTDQTGTAVEMDLKPTVVRERAKKRR